MTSPVAHHAPPRHVFHALDGLRWIAAVAVMARHMPDHTLLHLLPGSYLAVDLFFCLSGFVLANAYEDRLRSGAMGVGEFLRARVIRLWPLYLFATVIGAALGVFLCVVRDGGADMWSVWGWSLILGMFMLPTPGWASFLGFTAFSFASPAWSLFWEMVAGSVYAAIAPYLSGRRLGMILAVSGGGLTWMSIVHGTIDVGSIVRTFPLGSVRVAWPFFCGIGLHGLWRSGRLSQFRLPFPIAALMLVAILAIDPGPWRWAFDLLASLLLFPALVIVATGEVPERGKALLSRLGSASYALYLLHIPLLEWIQRVSEQRGVWIETYGVWGSFVVMTLAIILSFVAEALFDKPVRASLTAWIGSRRLEQPRSLRPCLGGHLGA